jgi:fibronectin type 3 domain-containing protein
MLQAADDKPEVYVAVARHPYPPRNLSAFGSNSVTISWQPHPTSRELKGYHVYRSPDNDSSFVELTTGAINTSSFTDNTVAVGTTYYYGTTSEEFSGLESDALSEILKVEVTETGIRSSTHITEGFRGWNKVPPAQIGGLTMQQVGQGQYRLSWQPPPDNDVRYYNIYYSVEGPPRANQERLIASTPNSTTTYLDWLARTDASPYYSVTAVDRAGNESAPTSSVPGPPDTTRPAPVRDLH